MNFKFVVFKIGPTSVMDRFLLAVEFTNSVRNNLLAVKSKPYKDFWQPTVDSDNVNAMNMKVL